MKKVLIIIPFRELYPPMNGGKQRSINLLHQLARKFEVTAILHQDLASFSKVVEDFPHLRSCTVFSTGDAAPARDLFSLLPGKVATALRYRWWKRSFRGPAEENFMLTYPVLKKVLKGRTFDHVILEEMGSLGIAAFIRRKLPGAKVIYDAHNVNIRLAAKELEKGIIPGSYYEIIRREEFSLHQTVDAVFTCSDQDLAELIRMNGNKLSGTVIPNGVNIPDLPIGGSFRSKTDDLLFCGSLDYFPNREGLTWFCNEVFPLLRAQRPSVRLLVVGRGEPGEELQQLLRNEGIVFYGMVDRVSEYYRKAAIAIVPLLSGSGTRLKLLEAMGFAVPVVSTTVGAEGIDYTDKKEILTVDEPAAFAGAIVRLLEDPAAADKMAMEAYAFAKGKYDWKVVGDRLSVYLNAN